MTGWGVRAVLLVLVVLVAGCASGDADVAPDTAPAGDRLLAAAEAGDVAALRRALADGAPVDGRDRRGRTPLMVATVARRTEVFRALLDAGADVDLQDDQRDNPFLYAGAEGILDILQLAHQAGADPTITNRFGGTALIPAAERGHVDVVRYLLTDTAVDVNHVNRLGWTALLEAIVLSDGGPRHQQIVQLLIEHGADVDIPDGNGVRPLALAQARGQTAVVGLLTAAGARP
jgi:ankyrin repeat protein